MELILALAVGYALLSIMIGIIEVLAGIAIMIGIGWGVGWLYQYAISARLCREAAGRYGCHELRDGMVALVSVGAWFAGLGAIYAPRALGLGVAAYLAARMTFAVAAWFRRRRR